MPIRDTILIAALSALLFAVAACAGVNSDRDEAYDRANACLAAHPETDLSIAEAIRRGDYIIEIPETTERPVPLKPGLVAPPPNRLTPAEEARATNCRLILKGRPTLLTPVRLVPARKRLTPTEEARATNSRLILKGELRRLERGGSHRDRVVIKRLRLRDDSTRLRRERLKLRLRSRDKLRRVRRELSRLDRLLCCTPRGP